MAEEEVVDPNAPADEEVDNDNEATALAVEMGGNKMVPLSALIASKRETKALSKRVKELDPIAARVTEVDGKLEAASPIINAIMTNPRLRAEALRVAKGEGTRTSGENTEQPADDVDAREHAEDYGMYLADGTTPDTARARRALDRISGMTGRQTDAKIRPLAGVTLSREATQNLERAIAMTDDDGTPLATPQSIREVAQRLGTDGQHLLANPNVVEMIIDQAAGIDRRMKRTPKAADEPLYLAGAGGRSRAPVMDAGLRASAERLGLTAKDLERASTKLGSGKAMVAGRKD